jgi:hypothetical protein
MIFITLLILLLILPTENIVSASDVKATDLERIQTGRAAPDFNLESVNGEWIKLSNYKNSKNMILVFYRGWW